jgi:hypothetical protein
MPRFYYLNLLLLCGPLLPILVVIQINNYPNALQPKNYKYDLFFSIEKSKVNINELLKYTTETFSVLCNYNRITITEKL